MGDVLTVKGNRYIGKFKVGKRVTIFDRLEIDYCYAGTGIIEDTKTGEKYFFEICTDIYRTAGYNKRTMQDCVVNYGQKRRYNQTKVVGESGYRKIVDLSLEKLIAKVREQNEDIPTIGTVLLDTDELIQKGLLVGADGQILLGLNC